MMPNPAEISRFAVVDTCAVWNVLSSRVMYDACKRAAFAFTITSFIAYECLHKQRRSLTDADKELVDRLKTEQASQRFSVVSLTVEDLQDVARLELRKKVSKGELSAIAFSKRTGVPFQTDDQGARKLAAQVLPIGQVQTTPHLLGWLFFHRHLGDHELRLVLEEHVSLGRPLGPYFQEMYTEALRCRLMSNLADANSSPTQR